MVITVHRDIPRWTIDGELYVCNIWTSGLPCWRRRTDAAHACYPCRLTRLLVDTCAEAVRLVEGLAEQQAMQDDWYVAPLQQLRVVVR
jgi:hypothetical protein